MLNVNITPHREFLPADTAAQILFVMLKLRPTKEASQSRPPTAFTFAIDTSGSMYGEVGGITKIEIVIKSLIALVRSGKLTQNDSISIVQFDDSASTVIPLTPATQVAQLEGAINKLRDYSGGTLMAKGMEQALSLLASQGMTNKRALIFTDGETFDEDECRNLATRFASAGISISALGVGDEFNEDLLLHLSGTTAGQCTHIVAGNPAGNSVSIADLPNLLLEDYQQAQSEVVNNLKLSVKTVPGVQLTKVTRVYPDLAEFALTQAPYPIGSAMADDETVFILEFGVDSRTGSRMRIAQIGLTYDVPGLNRRDELPLQNLVVQFVAGQGAAAQVDQEVMSYVQQRNITKLVDDAARVAGNNPEQAEKLLENARRITVQIGNGLMEQSLNQGIEELRKTKQLSAGTRKTVKMGSRGKTVKMGDDMSDSLSDEAIRNLTGT
jgi:Ca-activated chloride channel homolog